MNVQQITFFSGSVQIFLNDPIHGNLYPRTCLHPFWSVSIYNGDKKNGDPEANFEALFGLSASSKLRIQLAALNEIRDICSLEQARQKSFLSTLIIISPGTM
jgi:hypothetical protein